MLDEPGQIAVKDNLVRLEEALPNLAAAQEQKRLGLALQQAQSALQAFEGQLAQFQFLGKATELLAEFLEPVRRDIEDVVDEVEELAAEMEEADSQHELYSISQSFPALAQKHIPRFHRAVLAMVGRYATKNISSLATLGKLLVKIGEKEVGEKLQKLETDVRRLEHVSAAALPGGIEAIETQRVATQAELTALAEDPEVDAFLMALSRGQSSLTLVTPKVLVWLDKLNARDQFRVLSA